MPLTLPYTVALQVVTQFVYLIDPIGGCRKVRVTDGQIVWRQQLLETGLWSPGERDRLRDGTARQITTIAFDPRTVTVFLAWPSGSPGDPTGVDSWEIAAISLARKPARIVARVPVGRTRSAPELLVTPDGDRLLALVTEAGTDRDVIRSFAIPDLAPGKRWVASGRPVPWTGSPGYPWRIAALTSDGPSPPAEVRWSGMADSLVFPAGRIALSGDSFYVVPHELRLGAADSALVRQAIPARYRFTSAPVAVGFDGVYWKAFAWPDSAPVLPEVHFRTGGTESQSLGRWSTPPGRAYPLARGTKLLLEVDDRRSRQSTSSTRATGELIRYDGRSGREELRVTIPALQGGFGQTGLRCSSADGTLLIFRAPIGRTMLVRLAPGFSPRTISLPPMSYPVCFFAPVG